MEPQGSATNAAAGQHGVRIVGQIAAVSGLPKCRLAHQTRTPAAARMTPFGRDVQSAEGRSRNRNS
jgi:hypothetical protein